MASGSIPQCPQGPHPLQISPAGLADLKRRGVALPILDVREPWEIEPSAFAGSRQIPMEEGPHRLTEWDGEGWLIAHCNHGFRSLPATHWLRERRFEWMVNYDGGIDRWARVFDPTRRTY